MKKAEKVSFYIDEHHMQLLLRLAPDDPLIRSLQSYLPEAGYITLSKLEYDRLFAKVSELWQQVQERKRERYFDLWADGAEVVSLEREEKAKIRAFRRAKKVGKIPSEFTSEEDIRAYYTEKRNEAMQSSVEYAELSQMDVEFMLMVETIALSSMPADELSKLME